MWGTVHGALLVGGTAPSSGGSGSAGNTLWSSPDILARAKRLLNRPSTDEALTDEDWYEFATEANAHWMEQFTLHAPERLLQDYPPVVLTSSDGGYTYQFASEPLYAEVRASPSGRVLIPGPEWDPGADYAIEGQTMRIPNGKTRSFTNGPWARYVPVPGRVDADNDPTLRPKQARRLIVYRMCVLAAIRLRQDPSTYETEEQKAWSGDPDNPADAGILGSLKTGFAFQGMGAIGGQQGLWWRSPDLGG